MTFLFDLLYVLLLSLGWPLLLVRRWRRGPGSLALRERLGAAPSRPVAGDCVWVHGVSLGEINAARALVAELQQRRPEIAIVISSTTQTGLARARELFPKLPVFRFPLDFSWTLRRTFDRVRPSVIVLMELEVWPNLMEIAHNRRIPLMIANGRVTEGKSMARFRQPGLRWLARRMFSRVSWVGAQDETYRARFVELGAHPQRVHVVGSLKYDTAELVDAVAGQEQLADEMGVRGDQPLWVCGGTGPGEEEIALDAYAELLRRFDDLQLALVPRKPERFDEVARLIVARGFACLRRSTGRPTAPAEVAEPRPVFLGDTMGELRKFYGLCTLAFVGRSLVPMGGSDFVEVAALAKPVLIGPHTENFAEPTRILTNAGAARVVQDGAELAAAVAELLASPERRARMGRHGREAIRLRQGSTQRTVDQILASCDRS